MCERQDRGRQKAGQREWHSNRQERIKLRGAQGARRLNLAVAQRIEGALQRLDRKWQAVNAGRDHKPRERKCQRLASHLDPPAPYCTVGSQHDQKIESDNRRRQYDR